MRTRHAALVALLSLLPLSARADDAVTYPYPCVEHVHRTMPRVDAHVVVIDLACAEIEVFSTRPRARATTVSRFADTSGAQIAVNANFFESSPCGLAVGERSVWRDTYYDRCRSSFAFGPVDTTTRAQLFDSADHTRINPFPWAWNVVTGWPTLLREGASIFEPEEPLGMYRYHPRTAIGTTAGGTHLVLAVVDGRRSGLPGMTSLEMVPLLEEFAVADAINLDGGGSSALFIEREGGVVNQPSDRVERTVANHLGIRITSVFSQRAN
jgi:exopolysaccharide biosynthesis protein